MVYKSIFVLAVMCSIWSKEAMSGQTPRINETEAFITKEEDRLRVIRLLSLDVQEAELRARLAKMSQVSSSTVLRGEKENVPAAVDVELRGTLRDGKNSLAMLLVNGKNLAVKEGDALPDGREVAVIGEKMITLKLKSGAVCELRIGG